MLKVVDIFCGAGGLSYGFYNNKNYKIVFAADIDESAVKTYKANHSNVEKIECIDVINIRKKFLDKIGKIDVLLGGPPCQSYSTLGKRKMDERAKLFEEYLRILDILKPKIFVFENVTGILSMDKGRLFNLIKTDFSKIGYRLEYKILNSANFGVPQIRQRVILVGILENIKNNFKFPVGDFGDDLFNNKKFVSIKEALDDLPIISSGECGDELDFRFEPNNNFLKFVRKSNCVSEHSSPKNNPRLIEIMKTLKDGQDKYDLPHDLRPKSGYANTYAKMWWERPAGTITRNFATPSSSRCIHPRDSRALSIREGARLQSFPDDYKFCGTDSQKRLQIGNAVPPLLSIALAEQILKFFKE